MKYTDLKCIRCGEELQPSVRSLEDQVMDADTPPADGLIFISYGNYGSTVYDPCDPMGQEYLVIVLCDECAKAQAAPGVRNIMHICKPLPQAPPPPRYRGPWLPDFLDSQT